MNLDRVLDTVLDDTVKGVPGGTSPFALRDLAAHGWNVLAEDLPLPLLVMSRSAVAHNIALMARYCAEHRVQHAPHGKTSMAPQLFQAQLDAGCWGLTAATVEQLQVYLSFGVRRVLLANQLVGGPHTSYVVEQLATVPDLELVVWVDSAAGVEDLAEAVRARGLARPVDVCIEVGYSGGRTGVRDEQQLTDVLKALEQVIGLVRLVGVAAFEGGLLNDRADGSGTAIAGFTRGSGEKPTARGYLRHCLGVARQLREQGLLPEEWLLTAGGSTAFDAVVDVFAGQAPLVVLRSGCYVTHDHIAYEEASPLVSGNTPDASRLGALRPALELWTYVQSLPEPGLAILTCGRRDAPDDYGLPRPLRRLPRSGSPAEPLTGEVTNMNDQHAYLRYDGELHVGDRVVLGISHPCRAFDKWRLVPVVDDDLRVVDGVLTYF